MYIVDLAASQLLRIYTCDMFLDKSVAKVLEARAKMLIVIKREILDLDAALWGYIYIYIYIYIYVYVGE